MKSTTYVTEVLNLSGTDLVAQRMRLGYREAGSDIV